jgi:hypothetical protein
MIENKKGIAAKELIHAISAMRFGITRYGMMTVFCGNPLNLHGQVVSPLQIPVHPPGFWNMHREYVFPCAGVPLNV